MKKNEKLEKKENCEKQMIVKMQSSLYENFEFRCRQENRMISEVIRELMSKYIKGWEMVPVYNKKE